MMPGMTGLQFIEALHERVHQVAIIMLTGQATIETAVQAIKLGAYDYLPKPLESPKLRAVLEKGLKQVGFAREANVLRQKLESPLGSYGELIGKSATMRQVYQRLSQIPTDAAVLVVVKRHRRSLSRTIAIFLEGAGNFWHCIAAMASYVDGERTFGHEKGHSRMRRHPGCFDKLTAGPFFDEITGMATEVQAKFPILKKDKCVGSEALQVFPSQSGSSLPRTSLLAPPKKETQPGSFYRLNLFIWLPPPGNELMIFRYWLVTS
jgi:ActR/RegA family two-component response regulator